MAHKIARAPRQKTHSRPPVSPFSFENQLKRNQKNRLDRIWRLDCSRTTSEPSLPSRAGTSLAVVRRRGCVSSVMGTFSTPSTVATELHRLPQMPVTHFSAQHRHLEERPQFLWHCCRPSSQTNVPSAPTQRRQPCPGCRVLPFQNTF